MAGICYVLSLLPDQTQELLHLLYFDSISPSAICDRMNLTEEQFNNRHRKALISLRRPSRWRYIQHGIAGCYKMKTASEYKRGYLAGYRKGYAEGVENTRQGVKPVISKSEILDIPIEAMPISTYAKNCLIRANILHIRDLIALDEQNIYCIRGMGAVTADQIAKALHKYGIPNTAWDGYRLD